MRKAEGGRRNHAGGRRCEYDDAWQPASQADLRSDIPDTELRYITISKSRKKRDFCVIVPRSTVGEVEGTWMKSGNREQI